MTMMGCRWLRGGERAAGGSARKTVQAMVVTCVSRQKGIGSTICYGTLVFMIHVLGNCRDAHVYD